MKCVEEYLEAAVPKLDRTMFEKELVPSLSDSFPPPQEPPLLTPEDLDRLFKLMSDFHRNRLALEAMKKDAVDQDWKACRRLVRKLSNGLAETTRVAKNVVASNRGPSSSSVAKLVAEEIESLGWELKELSRYCLLQEGLFDCIRRSTRGTNELISALYDYLDEIFPNRKLEQSHRIAAAVLVAAGLRDPDIEPVSNMPMALCRANRHAEESYVPDPQDFDVEEEPPLNRTRRKASSDHASPAAQTEGLRVTDV